jgi:sarcosine oxidase, subunit beta
VLEKGWIGGGNTGRNTTIIRSNYLFDESAALYDHAVKLWESLSQALNYNVMFSPRGVMMLAHTVHDMQVFKRHVHANRCNGVDNEWLTPEQAKEFCPPLNISDDIRYPVLGAALQRAAARAPRRGRLGLCARRRCARRRHHRELRGHRHPARRGGAVGARDHDAAPSARARSAWSAAGHTSVVMAHGRRAPAARELSAAGAGLRAGQADFSLRRDVEHHPRLHQPVRQGRTGDRRRHRRLHLLHPARRRCTSTHTLDAICELFPMFRRLRMLRNWGGIVDVTPDRSPIIAKTPVPGLYVNCGWGTGGFKATPGSAHVFAWTIARGRAASDQRAVHDRALPRRRADRRGRRRRRGALRRPRCC